ncbi:hypothetical protein HYFRA_00003967, partial [Hymenoscyphus fraxineus]
LRRPSPTPRHGHRRKRSRTIVNTSDTDTTPTPRESREVTPLGFNDLDINSPLALKQQRRAIQLADIHENQDDENDNNTGQVDEDMIGGSALQRLIDTRDNDNPLNLNTRFGVYYTLILAAFSVSLLALFTRLTNPLHSPRNLNQDNDNAVEKWYTSTSQTFI